MAITQHIVTALADTSGGTQDFTVTGAQGDCKAYIIEMCGVTESGVASNGVDYSFGAGDGTRRWCVSNAIGHNVDPTRAQRRGSTDEVIMSISPGTGNVLAEADFTSFLNSGSSKGIRITWGVNPTTSCIIRATLFFDTASDLLVRADVATGSGPNNTLTDITWTGGFKPETVIAASHGTNINDSKNTSSASIIGFSAMGLNGGGSITQACHDLFSSDANATPSIGGYVSDQEFLVHASHSNVSRSLRMNATITNGFQVKHVAGSSSSDLTFGFLALSTQGRLRSEVATRTGPTATGTFTYNNMVFTVGFAIWLINDIKDRNTFKNDGTPGTRGVSIFTSSTRSCLGFSDEDNAGPEGPSNSQSLGDTLRAINVPDDSGTIANGYRSTLASPPTFTGTSINIPLDTVGGGTAPQWPVLYMEADPDAGGNIAATHGRPFLGPVVGIRGN